jgi:hypothetical protein
VLTVTVEDATVDFDDDNPIEVPVAEPGGNSGEFLLTMHIAETEPDEPVGFALAGDIGHAQVSIELVPVGPGSPVAPTICNRSVDGTGYDAVLTVICSFNDVEVNTYAAQVTVGGDYYKGGGEDVLVVYDPSLGFATGGGWFYWPGSEDPATGYPGDKTNFGFTMKYNKKGQKVRGSLLLIRHVPGGSIYRVKSNALYGLALGEDPSVPLGWASFSGKSTYSEPGWPEPEGNYEFLVYVEDRNEPGSSVDRFWIEVKDKDGQVIPVMSMDHEAMDNAVELGGGNIVVPHGAHR